MSDRLDLPPAGIAGALVLAVSTPAYAGNSAYFESALLAAIPTAIAFVVGNVILHRRIRSRPGPLLGTICVLWALLQFALVLSVVDATDGILFPLLLFNIWGLVLIVRGLKPLIIFLLAKDAESRARVQPEDRSIDSHPDLDSQRRIDDLD